MSAIPMAITAQDVAKGLSMFEIDESLEALVEAAEQEAEANNGEISEAIKCALAAYAEAFGYKVDRIANYLKAQKAEAELAQREAERFQARYKAANSSSSTSMDVPSTPMWCTSTASRCSDGPTRAR